MAIKKSVVPVVYSATTIIFALVFFYPMVFRGDILGYSTSAFTALVCCVSVIALGFLMAIVLKVVRINTRWLMVLFAVGVGFVIQPTVAYLFGEDYYYSILPTPIIFPCIGLGILISVSIVSFSRRRK